jgi:hypothetical protein
MKEEFNEELKEELFEELVEELVEELFKELNNTKLIKECSICYNKIGEINYCITPCGHSFCFTCIIKLIKRKKNTCPNCRAILIEKNEADENISTDNSNSDNSDDSYNDLLFTMGRYFI